ncbi:secreted protein containing Cysteine, histidine-dependent amidohydrolase/peptidase domain protein [Candidatus Magnetomorum sp. HK-1]|nr:secreted protein containing Cysteine, histidine-dependent amidohydrolase/peptidase domain protein [Candidatus Magnetomorum sp. HK-1]
MHLIRNVKSFWIVFFLLVILSVQNVWSDSWNFSSSLDGWTGRNCFIKYASDGNGRLYMYPEGNDPGIVRSVNFSASSNNILKMYIWTYCPNKTLKLYFRSNSGSIQYGPSISLDGGQSGKEYSIDLRDTSSWTGTITELRIDPTDSCGASGDSGFIGFDYIKTDYQAVDMGYYWDSGSWSSCSTDCGSGTQTRSVVCKNKYGSTQPDYNCSGSKPDTSRSCYEDNCGYYWDTVSWSSCSSTCGSGTQSRSVTCRNKYGSSQSDAKCSEAGSKPDTSKSCFGDSSSCYSWFTGGWSDCSNNCGNGNKTRHVECRDYYGNVANDSKCIGTKPANSESCSEFSGCKAPVAKIEYVQPLNASVDQAVVFDGSGSDPDGGNIQAYEWSSNIDGVLSESQHFQRSDLSIGQHTISLKVKDDEGNWSELDTVSLTIENINVSGSVTPEAGQVGTLFTWNAILDDSSSSSAVAKLELVSPIDSQTSTFNMKAVAGKPGHFEYSKELLQLGEYSCRIIIEFSDKDNLFSETFSISVSPVNTVDDYPYKDVTSECHKGNENCSPDPWSFCRHNCTSWVAWKVNQAAGLSNSLTDGLVVFYNGMTTPRLSHAKNWASRLSEKFTVDQNPAPGAIAQWDEAGWNLGYGHVAYVHSVNPDGSVVISEYNFSPACGFNTRTVGGPGSSGSNKPDHYIHVEADGFGGGVSAIFAETLEHDVSESAGQVTFDISCNDEWSIESDAEWLSIQKTENGIQVNYDQNNGDERIGNIIISSLGAINSPLILSVNQNSNTVNTPEVLVVPEKPSSIDLIHLLIPLETPTICYDIQTDHVIDGKDIRVNILSVFSPPENGYCAAHIDNITIDHVLSSLNAGEYHIAVYFNKTFYQDLDIQVTQEENTVLIEEFDGTANGDSHGIEYVRTPNGMGAKFSRVNESRIQYPFDKWMVKQGSLEFLVKIDSGYDYRDPTYSNNAVLYEGNNRALLFTTDVQHGDVYWPGSTWFYVKDNGVLSISMATKKGTGSGVQSLSSPETGYRFNEWHYVGISFGSEGQFLMVDGKEVASNPAHTQILGSGGTHSAPVDKPTIGESLPGFWHNNQWEGGFEGIVDRFRISNKQRDWKMSLNDQRVIRIEVNPENIQFDAEGGVKVVQVTSNSKWSSVPNNDWISAITDSSGLSVKCEENFGQERQGSISIVSTENESISQTILVSQKKKEVVVETHYQPVWINGNPYNPMNLWITSQSIIDFELSPGDEIGIFDGEICVGSGVVDENSSNEMIVIITSEDDGSGNGFSEGHKIGFRIWDASQEIEYQNIAGVFYDLSTGNEIFNDTFKGNDDRAVQLKNAFVEQIIDLKSGWNVFSTFAMPEQPDMLDVLKTQIDGNIIEKVIDEQGNRIIFSAFTNNWINQIGDISNAKGYQIKTKSDTSLNITGTQATLPFTLSLSEGWNIIAYPCDVPQNALQILASLIDEKILIKMIDESGNRIIYSAFNDSWINQIGNLAPGKGYMVKVSEDTELTINIPVPNNSRKRSGVTQKISDESTPKHCSPVWDGHPYNSMKLWIFNIENYDIEPGDEICVLDNENCVGVGIVDGQISPQNMLTITASQDDGSGNGFQVGNPIHFVLWDESAQKEITSITATFLNMETAQQIDPQPGFEGNTDVAVKLFIEGTSEPEDEEITDIRFTNITGTQMTVSWRGKSDVIGKVHYGYQENNVITWYIAEDDRGNNFKDDIHHVTLTALSPESTYLIEIISGDEKDNNNGKYYQQSTGTILAPVSNTCQPSGKIYSDPGFSGPAHEDVIVYVTILGDEVDNPSSTASVLAENGYWFVDLVNLRTTDYQDYYTFTCNESLIFVEAQGGSNGSDQMTIQSINFEPDHSPIMGTGPAHTINVISGNNGSISPKDATQVKHNASLTIFIQPDTHFDVEDVTIDGQSIGALNSYTFTNVKADHTVEAYFVRKAFVISSSADTHGQISPNGSIAVSGGDNQPFMIIPDACYYVYDVKIDDQSIGQVEEYIFQSVDANHSIKAFFEVDTYDITSSAKFGGTISPSGSIKADCGDQLTFQIVPDDGFSIDDVKVDQNSVGSVAEYTLKDIKQDSRVEASFSLIYSLNDGWNLISLALESETKFTASSLANSINQSGAEVKAIQKWFGSGWKTYNTGAPFGDFDIEIGKGYNLLVTKPGQWKNSGNRWTIMTYEMQLGYNLVGFPASTFSKASDVTNEMNTQKMTITKMLDWNGNGWNHFSANKIYTDYDLNNTHGYFLFANEPLTIHLPIK